MKHCVGLSIIAAVSVLQVKVDLVGLAQECCPELDLKAELERSFLSEPSSPGHSKAPKGFRLGKHKHETFITRYRSSVLVYFFPYVFRILCKKLTSLFIVFVSSAVSRTTSSRQSERTSWQLLAAVEVEEGSDRISTDRTISSASANRTPPVLPVCTSMTLWRRSLKTLGLLLDFCLLNGPPRAPQNPPPEDCSLATEAGAPSTARLASSLHHSPKGFCCPVRTHRHSLVIERFLSC